MAEGRPAHVEKAVAMTHTEPERDPAEEPAREATVAERAQAAVARLAEIYAEEWAPAAIDEMYQALAAAKRERAGRRDQLYRIYRLGHDMKGQGATFGFPVLTEVGESLCRFTAGRDDLSEGEFAVLRAHVDAARTIIRERLDGNRGRRLLAGLRAQAKQHFH
jgi:hypothetical protein